MRVNGCGFVAKIWPPVLTQYRSPNTRTIFCNGPTLRPTSSVTVGCGVCPAAMSTTSVDSFVKANCGSYLMLETSGGPHVSPATLIDGASISTRSAPCATENAAWTKHTRTGTFASSASQMSANWRSGGFMSSGCATGQGNGEKGVVLGVRAIAGQNK